MRVGIVGSRRRNSRRDELFVRRLVRDLPEGTVVVSGGCEEGADFWAEDEVKQCKHLNPPLIFRPNFNGGYDVRQYHIRNQQIAQECDVLVALPSEDREGGTESTISAARRLGKVFIIIPKL